MQTANSRLPWADWIRVLSIFLVIIIHVNALIVIPWEYSFSFAWWTAHVFSSIAVVAVPFLVILSGSLLLGKTESAQIFYRKRARKIILPWIFWLAVTFVLDYYVLQDPGLRGRSLASLIGQYLMTGYWFMPVLFQLYLVTPLLRRWIPQISRTTLAAGAVGLVSVISLQYTFCATTQTCAVWPLPLGLQYLGYFILGYILRDYTPTQKAFSRWAFGWGLGVSAVFYATLALSKNQQGFSGSIYHYISLPVALSSISGFVLLQRIFRNFAFKKLQYRRWLESISKESFSIFFMHTIILRAIVFLAPQLIVQPILFFAPLFILLISILLFVVSYAIVVGLRKLPLFKFVA